MSVTPSTRDSAADRHDTAERLLRSSAELSLDPMTEIDWDAPLEDGKYGMSPEWCSLYGTRYWAEMTEDQRVALTRHETATVASTGIWFEMILQQMILRDFYAANPADPSFRWALTEIADECRHSNMFARMIEAMGTPLYLPKRWILALGRLYKSTATGEGAYAAVLVAEEVLDVMQRDWMRDERVLPMLRTVANIHVIEESRHMKFAREETREALRDAGPIRRRLSALYVALVAFAVVDSMWNAQVYANIGLDRRRAVREAKANEARKALLRSSVAGLMEFLNSCGLLTRPAMRIYRAANLI
ncbi:AurF N-oxygenase family protein [Pseudonocardia phyllosphaerae]|uniref:AurF N-oxygenase family protein n=1 Tax=Pseudonocardia phyllosphaerae TaxID=3390502 RepID=UPI00397861B9